MDDSSSTGSVGGEEDFDLNLGLDDDDDDADDATNSDNKESSTPLGEVRRPRATSRPSHALFATVGIWCRSLSVIFKFWRLRLASNIKFFLVPMGV